MNKELNNYIKKMNLNSKIKIWLNTNVEEKHTISEVEHIIDYIVSKDCKNLEVTYNRMSKNAKKWLIKLNAKGNEIKETKKDVEVFMSWKNGFKIVKLLTENAYKREGYLMGSCVSSYFGKDDTIYSLRDKNNLPHATLSSNSLQIKGKGNGSINPKYIKYNVEFLEKLGIDVRDSEMKNLGYMNVEKWIKRLHKDSIKTLFRKKYWFFYGEKLKNKKGEEFADMDMWDFVPLLSEKGDMLLCNYNLNTFLKASHNNLIIDQEQKREDKAVSGNNGKSAVSGNYGKSAVSGHSGKSAVSGDSGMSAVSGNYGKSAVSGNYGKSAVSGHYGKSAVSGDYGKSAVSGDSGMSAVSGNYGKSAVSGNYGKSAVSGNYGKSAVSGNYGKSAVSGDYGKSAVSGDSGMSAVSGLNSVACVLGKEGQVKGSIDSWLILTEYYKNSEKIKCVKSVKVDNKKVKANVWYQLKNRKFVKVEEQ